MLLSGVMLIVDLFFARKYMGLVTFINMFLTGYIVDITCVMINYFFPSPVLSVRIVFLLIAVLVMCFSSSLYMTSNMGVSVYDAIPLVITDKSKAPFRFIRVGCDLICVIIGTLSGLMPGMGTIITAFFMGPLIEFFNHNFSEPLLFGKKKNIKYFLCGNAPLCF